MKKYQSELIFKILFVLFGINTFGQSDSESILPIKFSLPTEEIMIQDQNEKKINPLLKKLKIVTFINGDCGDCVLELKEWKKYMSKLPIEEVGFLFIVYSSDNLFTFKILNRDEIKLSYPYFNDSGMTVKKRNNISKFKSKQTFLLDEKNNIIHYGNPTSSLEQSRKYEEIIAEKIIELDKPIRYRITQTTQGTDVRIEGDLIWKDSKGNVIDQDEAEKMLDSGLFYPNFSPATKTMTLLKKN